MLGKRKRRQRKAQEEFLDQQIKTIQTNQQQEEKQSDVSKNPYAKLLSMVQPQISKRQIIKQADFIQNKKDHGNKETTEKGLISLYKELEKNEKIVLKPSDKLENWYTSRELSLTKSNLTKLGNQQFQQTLVQTKVFPNMISRSHPSVSTSQQNLSYQVAPILLTNSAFHKEFLDRSGLSKPYSFYKEKQFASAAIKQQEEDNAIKVMGLELFGLLRTGKDIRIEYDNSEELKRMRETYIYHILDYVLQDRERVSANDKKLFEQNNEGRITLSNVFELAGNKNEEEKEESDKEGEENESDDQDSDLEDAEQGKPGKNKRLEQQYLSEKMELIGPADVSEFDKEMAGSTKDQGFTRAKVLILTPFKKMAYQIVENIVMFTNGGKWKKVSKKKKFRDEFNNEEEAFNDYFRVGISFNHSKKTNKMTIKLFDQFYNSDIIVASPLGLRTLTGQEEDENAQNEQRVDYDFLSSIEFLVLDQAEAFIFQNIEHLDDLLKMVNKTPKKLSQLNDISRIKELYTSSSGQGDLKLPLMARQNIIISKFRNMDLEYNLNKYCNQNANGSLSIQRVHENKAKAMSNKFGLKFTLRRLPQVSSLDQVDDSRFNFFTKQIWGPLYEGNKGYTLLFVASYFDFVRLRTYMKNKNAQVAMISEYSEHKDCQRNRHYYETGERPILMITERALIFEKIKIRYARNIVLYSLPESPDTFTDALCELTESNNWKAIMKMRLNLAKTSKDKTQSQRLTEAQQILNEKHTEKSLVGLFSKFDSLSLERIVGTANYSKLLSNDSKDSYSIN